MGILSNIFGSSKVVEKGMDIADKAFYTNQEQAETDLEVKKLVTASKGSSLAIRIGFWMTLGSYILAFSISELCILFGSNELAVNISYLITTYNLYPMTLSFVSFYTGKKLFGSFNANKTMEKLTDIKKVEVQAKRGKPKYSEEELALLKSNIPNVILKRVLRTSDATQGVLIKDDEIFCLTLEKLWRDNNSNVSCIPAGVYRCEIKPSSKDSDGDTYQVLNVPNRSQVRIHSGNEESDSLGCILLASETELGRAKGKTYQYQSKKAVKEFEKLMSKEPFVLEIVDISESS